MATSNDISLIVLLSFVTLLPFLVACGTCYIKFSIVFVMVRNALGLQQIPSNMTLNAIALILAFFVMMPVVSKGYQEFENSDIGTDDPSQIAEFINTGLDSYRGYLIRYSDPELIQYFEKIQRENHYDDDRSWNNEQQTVSITSLLPAYALSEIKSAFKIGFYLYLPFVIIDLLVSGILLALGMMMMSPVTISVPIKLVLFVVLDGWTLLSKGLVEQYINLATG